MRLSSRMGVGIAVALLLVWTVGCSHVHSVSKKSSTKRHVYLDRHPGDHFIPDDLPGESEDMYGDHIVRVIGMGLAPASAQDTAAERVLAIRAGEADGYRKLAQKIYGVLIAGKYITKMSTLEREKIRYYLRAVVEGASISYEEVVYEDGVAQVPMSINVSHQWFVNVKNLSFPPTHH